MMFPEVLICVLGQYVNHPSKSETQSSGAFTPFHVFPGHKLYKPPFLDETIHTYSHQNEIFSTQLMRIITSKPI